MDNIKQKKVELLAPAGGMEQLRAAVENGADAVYIGGEKFNARINATNFSIDEIRDAICYAHTREVKIFVAINILISDRELQEALEYVAKLYEIGVDALIVQDIGLAYLIKKHIPKMPMHLSTQGSVYNRTGVKNALDLNFQRVVLAREMTLEEIKTTTDLCEIEVFVHGAMCMSYSGQCQMSRAIGGRSGNRGECAQPCRLEYTDDRGIKGNYLSPKDMCGLDYLGDLINAGVSSLKIEGRMKSPEYVATVVGIYRKYIDEFYTSGKYTVLEEDKEKLQQIFSRGKFTEGYLKNNPGKEILSGSLSKHQGIYIGKVIKSSGNKLVEVEVERDIEIGDVIEIRDGNIQGVKITYLKSNGKNRFILGDVKGNLKKGGSIYKIISNKQIREARESYRKMQRKTEVTAKFIGIIDKKAELSITYGRHIVKVQSGLNYERAIKNFISREKIVEQLKKTGNTPYKVSEVTLDIDEAGRISLAEINEMRRKALHELEKKMCKGREAIRVPKIKVKPIEIKEKYIEAPCYSNVTKGNEDKYIEKNINGKNVILNNLGWIKEFQDKGINVYVGSGVNAYNGATQEYFESLGVELIAMSEEKGANPKILMTTEHPINTKYIIDRKGIKYKIKKSEFFDKFYVEK